MKYRKWNFNHKLMVSYFALVWVVAGLISVSSYITFRKMYRQSTDEMNRKTLRATVEFYEEKIFQPVMKIYSDFLGASGIGKTGNLFYSERQLDTMEIYEINNSIRSEAAKNEFISEIHLYNSRRQQMISSRFGYKSGEDIEKILKNYSIDDQWLDQVKFPVITQPFRYSDDASWYYNIIYSVNLMEKNKQAHTEFIIFTMNGDSICEMMNQNSDDKVYIISRDGVILCHPQTDMTGKKTDFDFRSEADYSVSMEEDRVISCMGSPANDLYFVVETSVDGFYPAVHQLIGQMVVITMSMILAGGIAAILISRHMSRPIQQVVDMISDTLPEGMEDQKQDLKGIVNTICDEFHSLDMFMKNSRETIKNNYILSLYWNQTGNQAELEEKKNYIGISCQGKYLPALINYGFYEQISTEARQMAIYKYIHDLQNSAKSFSIIASEVEENIIAVICCGEEESHMSEEFGDLNAQAGSRVVMYLGDVCGSDKEMGESFGRLKELMSYRFFYPERRLWLASKFKIDPEAKFEVNTGEFLRNLKANKPDTCAQEVKEAFEKMDERAVPYEVRQETLLKYISAVSETARSAGIRLEGMMKVVDSGNIWLFQENLMELIQELQTALEERQKSKKTEEIEMIRSFILQHYNQDISLNMIAQNMHMSTSYISRFFKEKTGQNITEYIKEIKLSEAEKLLTTTNDSVEKIAGLIGYNTTHYFIKQFKEKYGETPTVYRKNHQAK